jgi:hypothetical protein
MNSKVRFWSAKSSSGARRVWISKASLFQDVRTLISVISLQGDQDGLVAKGKKDRQGK